jgi:hypothetical protein
MEYKGKLWGKEGNEYFPLQETSEDVDKMKAKLKELEQENKKLYWQLMNGKENLMPLKTRKKIQDFLSSNGR